MESPLGLGPRTKLGLLGHLQTCIGLHTKLWVQSLGIACMHVRKHACTYSSMHMHSRHRNSKNHIFMY